MFRIAGNIKLDDKSSSQQECKLNLKIGKKTNKCLSFIQYLQPLTIRNPYFYVHITNIKPDGIVTIGIASLDIDESNNPGYWNNTIGYESQTGKCVSSHRVNANTSGRPVVKDDTFGLFVSNFGTYQSTVLFIHNNEPIASRYHFEVDHNKYLPTITFENGPIEVDIYWQNIVEPILKENKFIWIKPSDETCLLKNETEFENVLQLEDVSIQSCEPLSRLYPHYKCIQLDISETGQGASAGIASCSPLKPTPTCSLLRDYYTWLPKMKLKHGQSIGWGIFYNPHTPKLSDKSEQLALVYVTFNDNIVDVLFVLQPEGGFFPLVLMQPWAKKVKLEITPTINQDESIKLTKLFNSKLQLALEIYNKDINESMINANDIIFESESVNITIETFKTVIQIPANNPGAHLIQYNRRLTNERRFFFIEINKLNPNSNVIIGVSSSDCIDEDEHILLGKKKDTIGYYSKTGQMYYNGKSTGNMMGQKCLRGDCMGLEIGHFDKKMSVALFTKNFKPIGTRYLTLEDSNQFYPSIEIESSGEEIEIIAYWQTVVSMPPHFNIRNPEDWCMPENTKIDPKERCFILPNHNDHSLCLQAPYSLHSKYNHFEIVLLDEFDKNNPPPAIALCTASPLDPAPKSQFKQDYLRFWPVGEAMTAVKRNDRLGWGIYNAGKSESNDKEHLMICFLTINRQVVYIRVLFQPPGGFYPVIIVPPNVFRIKMDAVANRVNTEDFGAEQIKIVLLDAYKQIESEKSLIAQGKNPRDETDDSKRSKMCNIL